jgi:hypothetical protein
MLSRAKDGKGPPRSAEGFVRGVRLSSGGEPAAASLPRQFSSQVPPIIFICRARVKVFEQKIGNGEGKFSAPSDNVRLRAGFSMEVAMLAATCLTSMTCVITLADANPSTIVCEIKNEVLSALNASAMAAPLTTPGWLRKGQKLILLCGNSN